MTLLTAGAACLIADLLLLSAGYKLFRRAEYQQAIHSYRSLRRIPPRVRSAASMVIPPVELAVAGLVLVPATRTYGLAAATAILLIFYVVVGGDDRQVIANCGCWGRASVGVSRRVLLARNIVLTIIAGGGLALSLGTSATVVASGSGNRVFQTLIVAGLALPLALLLLEMPELHMLAKLSPTANNQH